MPVFFSAARNNSSATLVRRIVLALAAITILTQSLSCTTPPKNADPVNNAGTQAPGTTAPLPVLWSIHAARRQTTFMRMNLPVITSGMRIDIAEPTGPAPWITQGGEGKGNVTLYSSRILRGSVSGPQVEQLIGYPAAPSDAGSYLVPLSPDAGDKPNDHVAHFVVREPMPVFMKLNVSALQDPGDYQFPVTITLPGKPPETAGLAVTISEVALPTDPRVLAVATTTTADLARIFPDTFGTISPTHLDRGEPADRAAVAQLDTLVKVAQQNGISLFVEDITPQVKVDEVGRVTLNWNAYDRLVQPYMDGSAFADRTPLPAWLAPAAPRRISESPTQLRQFIAACAQHFSDKAWVATPAFMHEALVTPEEDVDVSLRNEVSKMLRLHMTRDMLAVTTPDASVPQPRLWVIDDSDPRLPPAGPLATEETVRLWPWVCAARTGNSGGLAEITARGGNGGGGQVKGFVWRHALESTLALDAHEDALPRPLFVVANGIQPTGPKSSATSVDATPITPSLRMLWLAEGLNDVAMIGLLEQRSDPALVQELFAGIVGRTGLTDTAPDAHATPTVSNMPLPSPGYLYAGWPDDKSTWTAMPGMLEKLVFANDPGSRAKINGNDPLYMATKLWLANARRPVARVGDYALQLRGGREGDILDWQIELLLENPVNDPVQLEARIPLLPGDLDLPADQNGTRGRRAVDAPAQSLSRLSLPIVGHLDSLEPMPATFPVELSERHGGALLQFPLTVPVFCMHPTEVPLKIDGQAADWPNAAAGKTFGIMTVGTHYLSRPDLLRGTTHADAAPATARWTYDNNYLYVLIHCPQTTVADERNNDWPMESQRWWGTDGVQIQLADPGPDVKRIIQLGFKPGGAMLTRVAELHGADPLHWTDGPPGGGGGGVHYGTSIEKDNGRIVGYIVEAAIPRKWFAPQPTPSIDATNPSPAWRVNIMRHRASDLTGMSWSGPLINDEDIPLMGLLIAKP